MNATNRNTPSSFPGLVFQVICAKSLGTTEWNTAAEGFQLQALVIRARQSYVERYGNDVPLLDVHDNSAAVYLVRVCYDNKEEWLSARFSIPQLGFSSISVHEFLQSTYKDQPLFDAIEQYKPEHLGHIAIVSRICGFVRNEADLSEVSNRTPLRCTAYAFALMLNQMMVDYGNIHKIRYFIGLYRDELVRKSLTLSIDGLRIPRFTYGSALFSNADRTDFRIDRSISAFVHPAYFFKADELGKGLRMLIALGMLSKEEIARHLVPMEMITPLLNGRRMSYRAFSMLGRLLKSVDVRSTLDPILSDGPELRVLNTTQWDKHFKMIIDDCSVLSQ